MEAPVPLIVVDCPTHSVAAEVVVPTLGNVLTVTKRVTEATHPLAAVPVTVYVVVDAGETITGVPDKAPGCQLYVLAPLAEMVVDCPTQIVALVIDVVIVGKLFTVISRVAVAVQPEADVPVTV